MKKTITLILILLSFGYANAQAPAIQWQKCYGGTLDDYALSIQLTTDGGYILAGRSKSNDGDVTVNHGYWDYWIVKLGITGAIQWQKSFGGSFDDEAFAIKTTLMGVIY